LNIAFIGCGQVGAALADRLQRLGHDVVLAAPNAYSESLRKALDRNPELRPLPPKEAVKAADIVFLAVPFKAVQAAIASVYEEIEGKILVDCTNPIGPDLTHGLGSALSGSETLQSLVPGTDVVKAFSIYGFENFEDNRFPGYGIKPAMMFCGRSAEAKGRVGDLIAQLGWEPLDVGGLEQALHLEHMTLLWVRMVRLGGASPRLAWAALRA
jgi:8-hydroxy-5-deazaflavin:NADPH oxidoreductase